MKSITIFLLVALCLIMAPVPGMAQLTLERIEKLLNIIRHTKLAQMPGGAAKIVAAIRDIRGVKTCDPNVCFAIDGSGSFGERNFNLQKDFVAIVSAIVGVDPGAEFAAVQYGFSNKSIRNLGGNPENFLLLLEKAEFSLPRRTYIGAGVAYCARQLDDRRGEPSKIVVLGDGRSTYNAITGPLSPVAIADRWRARSPANKVCAVAVGFPDASLFEDIADSPDLVLEVTDWERVLDILGPLVLDICKTAPDS